MGML
jgi:hypothetical protein